MKKKLKEQIGFVLDYSKGYFKGCFCHPIKAQMLDKLLNKKELTAEDREWIAGSPEVTAFEQSMLYTLSNIVFVINRTEEE